MTKQELEKAIENKDTIWYIDSLYDTPKDMLLHGIYEINSYIYEDVGRVYYLKDVERNSYYRMDYMFKTQAQAKHYSYRSNITRTETLPFLTWEEFNKDTLGIDFTDLDGNKYRFHIVRDYRNGKDTIVLYDKNGKIPLDEEWEATEENFYKAYDECVRLFRGEE